MVLKPTVFVLGAGASAAYGFPQGRRLGEDVCKALGDASFANPIRKQTSDRLVSEFAQEFKRSGRYSIDEFVQGRKEFKAVAKMAIAGVLSRLESEDKLLSPNNEDPKRDLDWYRYFLNEIVPPRPEDFQKNQLKVITFNFDRSLEKRLHISLKATYGMNDSDAAALSTAMPILHLHGQLGKASWLDRGGHPYKASAVPLYELGNSIDLVDDELPSDRIALARQYLDEAEQVCFLGFGYLRLNLERLRVAALSKTVVGTCLGMEKAEIEKASDAFTGIGSMFRNMLSIDILTFLRQEPFIHQ